MWMGIMKIEIEQRFIQVLSMFEKNKTNQFLAAEKSDSTSLYKYFCSEVIYPPGHK